MKGLMIGFSFALPYHVMRCATKAGLSVQVLGNGPAVGLAQSRLCAGFNDSAFDQASPNYDRAAEEIRALALREGLDVVFPSDDVSTRLLAAVKDKIGIRTAAIPTLESFDSLNDKWNFNCLAVANAVRVPESRLYESVDELRRDLKIGSLECPVTVKPTNRSGSVGVHHIRCEQDLALLDRIDYRPVLAQRTIKGREVGINVLCEHGKITAHAIQERFGRSFRLFENADLLANVERIARAANLHGPANIDAILEEETGLGYILECNPRFWYTIYMSMVLGLNFVAMSLALGDKQDDQLRPPPSASVRLNGALFLGLLRPWTHSRADWRMLRYHLADPVPYFCEKKAVYDDRHVAVDHRLMKRYQPATSSDLVARPVH